MKKLITIASILIVLAAVMGCSTLPKSTSVDKENSTSEEKITAEKAPASETQTDKTKIIVESDTIVSSRIEPATQQITTEKMSTAEATTTALPAERIAAAEAKATETTEESSTQTAKGSMPEVEFDINKWISFAQNYAQSVGLNLESSTVDCWDNPIIANTNRAALQEDIINRLSRYKKIEGFTDVWIWYDQVSENEFEIYIGYA